MILVDVLGFLGFLGVQKCLCFFMCFSDLLVSTSMYVSGHCFFQQNDYIFFQQNEEFPRRHSGGGEIYAILH